jgi:hypothetical protein
MIFPHSPLRVFADPLGDIRLRGHDALLERTLPRKLKVFVLAAVWLRDCANQKDYFYNTHCKISTTASDSRFSAAYVGV